MPKEAAPVSDQPMNEKGGWTHRRDHDALRQVANPYFEAYYRDHQRIVPDQASWDSLMTSLRTPLPSTFWINDTDPLAKDVAAHFASMPDLMKPIPWYPIPNMGWHIDVEKKRLRKDPELGHLRQYLVRQTAMGTTSRQEAVSMIPPFLLELQATDRVLDMCASPGSKTAQLLAILGRRKKEQQTSTADAAGATTAKLPFNYLSRGCVVANEKDEKRANMLVHQVRRLRLLYPFAAFVNHDARYLPDLDFQDEHGIAKYDKVLCDVVCSGDGTLRKSPGTFTTWRAHHAVGLQRLQIQIALRGCHLLRVGGRLVYSTCSMNPIENEAVVAQLIQRTNGAMRLVDPTGIIPGLAYDAGLTTWKVVGSKGQLYDAPGEMHEACFPPADVEKMNLDRCMRLLPKHCDGGAFFVAILEKVADYEQPPLTDFVPTKAPRSEVQGKKKATAAAADSAAAPTETEAAEDAAVAEVASRTEAKTGPPRPVYVPSLDDGKAFLPGFLQLNGFPVDNLYTRLVAGETEIKRSLGTTCNLVANDVRSILTGNTRLIIVAAGLRVLAVETLTKAWRLAQESTLIADGFFPKEGAARAVPATPADIAQLCAAEAHSVAFAKIDDEGLRAKMEEMPLGSFVLRVTSGNAAQPILPVAAMRGRNRLQLLVDKDDLEDLKCRLNIAAPAATSAALDV